MTTYHCPGFKPLKDDGYEISSPREAAARFAERLARKIYGKAGYCHHTRLDTYTEDGRCHNYEAFIGKDLPRRYGGGCQGHNVWFTVTVRS
jgi:hypothetical protein